MSANSIKKTHGGKRKRSGRKPVLDKKVSVSIYPRLSRIYLLGKDGIRDLAHTSIEKEYLKRQKII